jgi:F0F1-type ATP synthase delta subunit
MNPIVNLIRTRQEQQELIKLLEILLEDNFKNKLHETKIIVGSEATRKIHEELIKLITSQGINDKPQEKEKFLNSLLAEVKSLKSIKITLAFEPSDQTLSKLIVWSQKNLKANLIFDISIDPEIMGGAIIVSDTGKYTDSTLSRKMDEFFDAKKLDLSTLL